MQKSIVLMMLVGLLCGACYPLCQCDYESGDQVQECVINDAGTMSTCVTMTLP